MFFTQLKKLAGLFWFIFSLSAVDARADETSSLNIHGFGTLGLARSSSSDVGFVRNLSQPKGIQDGEWSGRIDTILGVQAHWQITSDLTAVGQVVSRYKYDDTRDPTADLAFVKWVPDDRLSLRAGRIGSDVMMLADSRLVGYSYLTVRPSVDFFGSLFFSSFDGGDASLTLPLGGGLIRSKVFAGKIHEKAPGAPGLWDTSGSFLYGAVVDYFSGPWQFRISSSNIQYSNDLNFKFLTDNLYDLSDLTGISSARSAADAIATKDTNSHYYSLGSVYDQGPLHIEIAVIRICQETATFQDSESGYLLAGYRINTITPYIGISRWTTIKEDGTTGLPDELALSGDTLDLRPLNEAYQTILNASSANQTTTTLGVRWDVRPQIALKAQWDSIHADEKSRFPYTNARYTDWNGRTDVISLSMDFIF